MNYDLANELKDAGFPLKTVGISDVTLIGEVPKVTEEYHFPTLEANKGKRFGQGI